jgi:hypothetical protein
LGASKGVQKGTCGVCGQGVFSCEARLRDSVGTYYHEACKAPSARARPAPRASASSSATQIKASRGASGGAGERAGARSGKESGVGGWVGAAALDEDDSAVTSLAAQWGPFRPPKPSGSPRDVTAVGTSVFLCVPCDMPVFVDCIFSCRPNPLKRFVFSPPARVPCPLHTVSLFDESARGDESHDDMASATEEGPSTQVKSLLTESQFSGKGRSKAGRKD